MQYFLNPFINPNEHSINTDPILKNAAVFSGAMTNIGINQKLMNIRVTPPQNMARKYGYFFDYS